MNEKNDGTENATESGTVDLLETLTVLDPGTLEIDKDVGEGLILRSPYFEEKTGVTVKAAFPVSRPHRFLCFRNEEGEEIGLLEDADDLPKQYREPLLEELHRQQFLPVITKVDAIYREFAIPIWEVRTDHGPRRLELKSTRDVHRLGGGRIYVRDSEGNGYVIPDVRELDLQSRELIELYV